jgi:hypothetical protein
VSEVLQLLKPITVTAAKLTAHNVAEPAVGDAPDPSAWSSLTTYTEGQRVHVASVHKIYEATSAASNTNKDPTLAANSAFWIEVGATNKWRMFDQKSTSQTTKVGSLQWTVAPGELFNGASVLNVSGADEVHYLQTDPTDGVVLDHTAQLRSPPSEPDYYAYCFEPIERKDHHFLESLPTYPNSTLQVTLTANNGTDVVGCGTFIVGRNYQIGRGVHYGARIGIQDYSRKERNAFGDLEVTERAYADTASFQMWVDRAEVGAVKKLLASVRAIPCLWYGSSLYDSTLIYGFYKDFEIAIQYFDVSLLSLELEGLT